MHALVKHTPLARTPPGPCLRGFAHGRRPAPTSRGPCSAAAATPAVRTRAAHEKKAAELRAALDKGTFGVSLGGPWFLATYDIGVLDVLTRYGLVTTKTKMSGNAQVRRQGRPCQM